MNQTVSLFSEILKKIKSSLVIILIISTILALAAFFILRTEKGTYSCYSKIFPLSANKSLGGSPLDAIKTQFGISDKTDYDKVFNLTELIKSRTISRQIISKTPKNKKYKTFADWIVADYNANLPLWKKKINTEIKKDSNNIFYTANVLFLSATEVNSDVKTNFTKITTKFYNKELSKQIADEILFSISDYYIEFSTAKPRSDLIHIGYMRDSLRQELYKIERNIAGFQDSNVLASKASSFVPQAKMIRNKAELEQLYAVTVTAYQNARFKLLSESPIFQVLDYPSEPLTFEQPAYKKSAAIVFALSFFLSCLFVSRKPIWRFVLQDIKS
ncbi:MAG: hypothetical protein IT215_01170 [Chitinophagaceae bacterium]|nr:hypothetical protein [Chitinophagaceae bacterium]HMN33506.1 hypothetical protein [Chitinophagaceae bacterium]